MDPFSKLNLKTDTTISLIKSGVRLGIEIWVADPRDLSFKKNKVFTLARNITNENLKSGLKKEVFLGNFDLFFIRQDPPFDMNYISNCYLLELHKKNNKKPYFINDPAGIKNFTEKIFPLYFYDLMPETVITSDIPNFKKFLKEHTIVVVKPLYLKGGEGITKITHSSGPKNVSTFKKILKNYGAPVVVQKFIDKVKFGDKRVILLDGNPCGVVNRIPKEGQFKANLHLGGVAEKSFLTKKEKQICVKLKPVLKKNKMFLVGIDLIDGRLTEINVTSPTGINQINQLNNTDLLAKIWRIIKNKV